MSGSILGLNCFLTVRDDQLSADESLLQAYMFLKSSRVINCSECSLRDARLWTREDSSLRDAQL